MNSAIAIFNELRDEWRAATWMFSDTMAITSHPAYQRIIGMGEAALPLIIQDLIDHGPSHWFRALKEITGENPIQEADWGDMAAMTRAWLRWAEERGIMKGDAE